jgi:hypothetical protein
MTKIALLLAAATIPIALDFSASPAQAQANRTFVSGKGTDTGTCALDAPCRTFAFAILQTAMYGEIDVLDSADYGYVFIDKPVSIVNEGPGVAGIQAGPGQTAIAIRTRGPVYLRGLTLDGLGPGYNGIDQGGAFLTVTNCTIRNFAYSGIGIQPYESLGNGAGFHISNSTISGIYNGYGISAVGSGGQSGSPYGITGYIDHTLVLRNYHGIAILTQNPPTGSVINVTIRDSNVSGNLYDAVAVNDANVTILNSVLADNQNGLEHSVSTSPPTSRVVVRNSVATGNSANGLLTNGILMLSQTAVISNKIGVTNSGTVNSYGDNEIDGNGTDISGSPLKLLSKQ